MPYAIKGPDGIDFSTIAETESRAWSYVPGGRYAEEAGFVCVPVTVSEGEAEKLLSECREKLSRVLHSDLIAKIDACLKGKS